MKSLFYHKTIDELSKAELLPPPSGHYRQPQVKGVANHIGGSYLRATRLKDAAVSTGKHLTMISLFNHFQNIIIIMYMCIYFRAASILIYTR